MIGRQDGPTFEHDPGDELKGLAPLYAEYLKRTGFMPDGSDAGAEIDAALADAIRDRDIEEEIERIRRADAALSQSARLESRAKERGAVGGQVSFRYEDFYVIYTDAEGKEWPIPYPADVIERMGTARFVPLDAGTEIPCLCGGEDASCGNRLIVGERGELKIVDRFGNFRKWHQLPPGYALCKEAGNG